MKRREFVKALGVGSLTLASSKSGHSAAASASSGPRAKHFPNFVLTTHEGNKVRFYDDLIRGKQVMINFMYAQCADICPGQTANLLEVQKALGEHVGRDIFMYSITLEPGRDTPMVLNDYAKGFGIGPGWLFLTGKPSEIEILRRKLGFVDPDPELDKNKTQHIGLVLYGIEPLDRWAACPALARAGLIANNVLSIRPAKRQQS